jgi:MFS family permease
MASRWNVLALLFTVRLSMAFQFQSVASLAPPIMKAYGVALSDVGLLISLYLAPGLLFALPGGEIGRRFGDKRIVVFALFVMILGGLTMTWAESWHWLVAGRVLSGIGGVLLNVLISKMVTDWFAGREIATAMAIIVNAWPAGIALSLLATPALVVAYGLKAAFLVATGFCAIGLILLSTLYRGVPQSDAPSTSVSASWPRALATKAVLLAGCIWGLYNAAMGMIFGFGPVLLAERGWSLAASGSATSLVLWIIAASVPIWGYWRIGLADAYR